MNRAKAHCQANPQLTAPIAKAQSLGLPAQVHGKWAKELQYIRPIPEGLALRLRPVGSSPPVLIQSLWLCSTGLQVMTVRQGRLSKLLLVMVKRSWLPLLALR